MCTGFVCTPFFGSRSFLWLPSPSFLASQPSFLEQGSKNTVADNPGETNKRLGPPPKKRNIYIYNVSSTKMNRAKQVFFLIL